MSVHYTHFHQFIEIKTFTTELFFLKKVFTLPILLDLCGTWNAPKQNRRKKEKENKQTDRSGLPSL